MIIEKKIIKYVIGILFVVMLMTAFINSRVDAKEMFVNSENGLRLREKPNEEANVILTISYGEKVKTKLKTFGKNDEWVRVRYNGTRGYVYGEFLQEEDPLAGMTPLATWHITAYTHTGSVCANGNYPTAGYTIAHNSLPFGTKVYISGIGTRVVEDRGPTWLGTEWCDIFMDLYSDCVQWGSQYREVYLIEEEE